MNIRIDWIAVIVFKSFQEPFGVAILLLGESESSEHSLQLKECLVEFLIVVDGALEDELLEGWDHVQLLQDAVHVADATWILQSCEAAQGSFLLVDLELPVSQPWRPPVALLGQTHLLLEEVAEEHQVVEAVDAQDHEQVQTARPRRRVLADRILLVLLQEQALLGQELQQFALVGQALSDWRVGVEHLAHDVEYAREDHVLIPRGDLFELASLYDFEAAVHHLSGLLQDVSVLCQNRIGQLEQHSHLMCELLVDRHRNQL